MKDMLDKILAVDKKAKETVDEARREKENVEKKLSEAKKAFEEEYSEKAKELIQKMKEEKSKSFESEETVIKESFENKKKTLEEIFAASSDKWAKEIADNVLNG